MKASLLLPIVLISMVALSQKPRARELGIPLDGRPGPHNAITDVPGVEVGHTTLIKGDGKLVVGQGPVRTGVTVIHPKGKKYDPVFAGWYSLNGNGEMTGTTWVEESGFLEGPIAITNTHSVGMVRDAVVSWQYEHHIFDPLPNEPGVFWALPIVAETYDGDLNDINGFHVKKEHVYAALDNAKGGKVSEGNVGGGTGMICHGFKGGIGTSSRLVKAADKEFTVGVLVQANYGSRSSLTIAGAPVGKEIPDLMPEINYVDPNKERGSIIVVVATDAPLLPHQLKRLARRVPIGISRMGGYGGNGSGDIFIAFSTATTGAAHREKVQTLQMLPNEMLSDFFLAVAEATEESILNALMAAETMAGREGSKVYELPQKRLLEILKKYNRVK
ncbi:MAG: P1 family peptidase [Cyclobacteriaceae bacterium]